MIKIICTGKIKEKYLNDLINDYLKRINKYHKLEIIELKDNIDPRIEATEILKHLKPNDYNIGLIIKGKKYDSLEFASMIHNLFNKTSNINFIIGGSNGLDDSIINVCQEKLSFSDMTFPHGLFRGILLEQIYRSFKINNNETYHK